MADRNATAPDLEGEPRPKYLRGPGDLSEHFDRIEAENAALRIEIARLRRENDLLVFTPSDEDRQRETEIQQQEKARYLNRIAVLEAECASLKWQLDDIEAERQELGLDDDSAA